jgi:hypothetical protein
MISGEGMETRPFGGARARGVFMLSSVGKNKFIPATFNGIIGFWNQGVDATRRAMNAIVRVVGSEPCDDVFFRLCDAQTAFLNLIGRETLEISSYHSVLAPRDFAAVSIFRHDRVDALGNKINMVRQHAWERGAITDSIIKTARASFHSQQSLDAIVRGIISSFQYDIEAKGILAGSDVDGDDLYFASPQINNHFVDALTNLISNAIKYSGEGRVLSVTREGETVIVADRGIGMMPEFFRELWTSVPRRENRAADVKGEGWGMVSVMRTVDELGWKLRGKSKPDEGTEWRLTIPAAHFVSRDAALRSDDSLPTNLSMKSLSSLATGVEILTKAEPFAGYWLDGDRLYVQGTAISKAVRMTSRLI